MNTPLFTWVDIIAGSDYQKIADDLSAWFGTEFKIAGGQLEAMLETGHKIFVREYESRIGQVGYAVDVYLGKKSIGYSSGVDTGKTQDLIAIITDAIEDSREEGW